MKLWRSLLAAGFLAATVSSSALAADKIAVLELEGPVLERPMPFNLFETKTHTLRDLTETIDKAAKDDEVKGLALKLTAPQMGLAQVNELRDHLMQFRESGKPTIALFDSAGMGEYLLASTADEIVCTPVGGVEIYGLAAQMYYFKDTLAKLGIEAQAINTGKFKTAFESFTHSEMSEGTQIQMNALLDSYEKYISEAVAEGRGMDAAETKSILWDGPYTAKMAKDKGLVTELAYIEPALDAFAKKHKAELDREYGDSAPKKAEPINFFALFSGAGAEESEQSTSADDKIALVYALGPIVDGWQDENPFASEETIASENFLETLGEIAKDKGTKAIVMRVDSPGGSAVASDRIWNRLRQFQEESDIPLVVSMGNVAGSGGYYISMGADKIFAEPTTITGSIGVIGGRFIMGETYNKLGLKKHVISRGNHTGLMDETRAWNEQEVALLMGFINDVYDTFTSKVAEGRDMSQDRVKELGGGRIYSGTDALEVKLIDELGGLDEAIASARKLAKLSDDAPVVSYPKEKSFMEVFEEMFSVSASASVRAEVPETVKILQQVLPPQHARTVWTMISTMKSDKPVIMMVQPMLFDIK